jgi:hypothetical protein
LGGGIWNDVFFPPPPGPQLILTNSTVIHNTLTAPAGVPTDGGGLFTTFPVTLTNTSIKHNAPGDCFGFSC